MECDPQLDKHFKLSSKALSLFFYNHKVMPCCFNYQRFFRGPRGGNSQNIKCFHCGHKWNICEEIKFIEDISPERKLLTENQKLELKNE